MRKINYKNLLLIIVMGVASVGVVKDLITLMNGATYTWFGLLTGLINIVIIGKGLDHIRG